MPGDPSTSEPLPASATERSVGSEKTSPSLLSGAEERFGFQSVGSTAGPPQHDPPLGTNLGGVTLIRVLAEGGMGRVYEARQEAPTRTVAVKVMRVGLFSASLARRFEYEAHLLARLRHPNIALIHTYGTYADGGGGVVPFFVMELVEEARPITRFVEEEATPIRERVAMFRLVCAAVAHGHQKGVIHRDLKPGNILVDRVGEPKVIDFGVARSTDPNGDDHTSMTRAGEVVGTLRYMSPEQLGIDDGDVDARSDVYALGLVLHEIVTGRLPYDLSGRSAVEAAWILGDPAATPTGAVERTAREAGRFSALDARALATIAAKCLEKRPGDRYATAVEVEAELSRWEAGEPILARPPTAIETVLRFARRHRAATAAAIGVLASLVIAVSGISVFYLRAERERALAVEARHVAIEAREVAEQREEEAARQAAAARAQLYISDVLLAAEARDRDNVSEAKRLLGAARRLEGDAGTTRPIELDCLAASLDESVATLGGHPGNVTAVAWSGDGSHFATGATDGTVRICRFTDGIAERPGRVLEGPAGPVWSIAFSPTGDLVASASSKGDVCIWGVADGELRTTLAGHEGATYAVAFSHDGQMLVTGGRERTARLWARLWDSTTWEARGRLVGHEGTVFAAAFSPDDSLVATVSHDKTVRLWDAATGTAVARLDGHSGRVFSLAFNPSGGELATASDDGTVRIWDLDRRGERRMLKHPFRVNGVAYLGAGDRIATASGDGVLRLWNTADGVEVARLRGHTAAIWSIAAVPGAAWVGTGSADGTARVWDTDFTIAPVMRATDKVLAVTCSPDQQLVATALANSTVVLWDAATLRQRGVLRKGVGRVNDVRFAPDGSTIAGCCDDGTVQLWDPASLDRREWFKPHDRRVYSVEFSRDGRFIATAAEDRTARVWSLADAAAVGPPLKHPKRTFCATFSPDGLLMATACEDRVARLWRLVDGTEVRRFEAHEGPVNWVAFSFDGRLIATACTDGAVRVFDVEDGGLVSVMMGPARQIWKLAFSPDAHRIAGVSADGTAQLWDVATGRAAPLLRGHTDQVWGVAFAPDGRSLFTGSWDGTARAWGVSVAEIARRRHERGRTSPTPP